MEKEKNDINESSSHQIIKDDEIDLIALIKTIWDGRKTIYYSVGVCVFIGLLIAFLSPAKYTASATLLPSVEKESSSLGGLSSLAGMAGVNLSSMIGQSSGISSEIYPQVVNSYPFMNEFIHEKFHFEKYEHPISIYDYVVADSIPTLGSQFVQYTLKLPWTLKNAIFSKNEENLNGGLDIGVLILSREELIALGAVFELFEVDVDAKTSLVNITVEAEEPVISAQYVQTAVDLLQKYIIRYKTKQVKENLDFVQEGFDEKKLEYQDSQKALYDYKDSHRNMISERMDIEYQRLSDDYDMVSSVYKGLAQQLEQAKIAVKEETPVFTVLEPAKVPFEKSSPRRGFIFAVSFFLGVFIGMGIIFVKLIWFNIKEKF